MTQLGLDWSAPSRNRREAREAVEPKVNTMHAQVLALLREAGPLSDEEMQIRLGWIGSTQRPRRRELVQAGKVVPVDREGRSAAGLPMTRWGIAP